MWRGGRRSTISNAMQFGQSHQEGQLACCLGLGNALPVFYDDFAGAKWLLRASEAWRVWKCVAEPLQTISGILLASKWSCWLLRTVVQDALTEVMEVYLAHEPEVFW